MKRNQKGCPARYRGLVALALMLIIALASVGGTVAWLKVQTSPVVNTFTAGDICITLTETTTDYTMVPGKTIAKDPKVTVEGGSEACWLFVKVEASAGLSSVVSYDVASGWTALAGASGVYYRTVSASATDQEFAVLKDNQVTVPDSVTRAELKNKANSTLTFTAYACQRDNVATAADAWAIISGV